MKTNVRNLFLLPLLWGSLAAGSACNNLDDVEIPGTQALVTVKQDAQKRCYLQLDDQTTLCPQNLTQYPYTLSEVRALVVYDPVEGSTDPTYGQGVVLRSIDSLLTKEAVPSLGTEEDKLTYGTDAVELFDHWCTVLEDGFLTLRFAAYWGYSGISHSFDLVYGANPEDPYEVHLHHNNHGDVGLELCYGLVAFSLRNLPPTGGETVDLKLVWQSGTAEQSVVFKYRSREGQPAL